MAKGGRRVGSGKKRKPNELRVLEGTFDKGRHGQAPGVVGGFPEPPVYLNETERQLWDELPHVAWIGESDRVAVHGAVSVYALIRKCQAAQRATPEAGAPLSYKYSHDSDGNQNVEPKENPLITQEIKLWGRLMSILGTLGLTPADRAKMTAPKLDDTQDKWAGIL